MTKKHQKHTKLVRPDAGYFGRNEWAILGTTCGKIKKIAYALSERLSTQYKFSFIDADHKHGDGNGDQKESALNHGASLEYTDKISFHNFGTKEKMDTFQYRQWFNEQDIILVNGNHFKAEKQIVVIDAVKEESLKKRLEQLTDVQLILMEEGSEDLYPFLKKHLKTYKTIPILSSEDIDGVRDFLRKKIENKLPEIKGLVLAGGKSQRMGKDKGLINFHGKPQREYLCDLLTSFCDEVFISCRQDQVEEINKGDYRALADTFTGLGPYGAILSAFREHPNHACLVVATDLPLLDESTISALIASRDPSKIATAFKSPVNDFPEPLITIWEPKSYPVLLQFLAQGYSCPRKVLINSNIKLLNVENPDALKNVNAPEDLEGVIKGMKK